MSTTTATTTTKPQTGAQQAFVEKLWAKVSAAVEAGLISEKDLNKIADNAKVIGTSVAGVADRRAASRAIEVLKGISIPPAHPKWVKYGDGFAVRGPISVMGLGEVVTVTKANGTSSRQIIKSILSTDEHTATALVSPAPAEGGAGGGGGGGGVDLLALFDGLSERTMYVADPDPDGSRQLFQIHTPDSGKWAGWVFVKSGSAYGGGRFGSQRPNGTYTGQHEDILTRIAADREAALVRYGHLTSTCGVCHRKLENGDSVARGIGPDCVKKL